MLAADYNVLYICWASNARQVMQLPVIMPHRRHERSTHDPFLKRSNCIAVDIKCLIQLPLTHGLYHMAVLSGRPRAGPDTGEKYSVVFP